MSRRLKDLYPCDTCGTGVEVRCRAEIQYARCPHCREYKRCLSCAAFAVEQANKLYEENRRVPEGDLLKVAPLWLEAAERALAGATWLVKAARMSTDPAERAKWVRIAITWSKWGTAVNDSARHHLSAEGVLPAQLVPSLPEPPKLSEPLMGHLKVVTFSA